MGAPVPLPAPSTVGHDLYSYLYRVLHALGIRTVNKLEFSRLSAPLIRIRLNRRGPQALVLANYPTPWHADEPIGWVNPNHVLPEETLFRIHFDASVEATPNLARLSVADFANAAPCWLAVDAATGRLSLIAHFAAATVFDLRVCTAHDRMTVALHATSAHGRFLAVHCHTHRARVVADQPDALSQFVLEHVPLAPTLQPQLILPRDPTLAAVCEAGASTPVRLRNVARNCFLACKPGAFVSAARSKDIGWDVFTLEFDCFTGSAVLKDARGKFLCFDASSCHLVACEEAFEQIDDGSGNVRKKKRKPERFYLKRSDVGNQVAFRSRKGYLTLKRGTVTVTQDTTVSNRELFVLHMAMPSMVDQSTPRLRLGAGPNGMREVEASVMVPVRAGIAYDVLTDYEGFKTFIDDASESGVVERQGERECTVRMVQCHTFLVLTVPMSMTLDVFEEPEKGIVTMKFNKGFGVRDYRGIWRALQRDDGHSIISCQLAAATTVPAPAFLTDGLMSHATMSTMVQLREECIRRAAVERREASNQRGSRRDTSPSNR